MDEPWNIKQEDARQADSLPNFIIFCEDEVSEPIYFKYFETQLIKVNPLRNQKSKIDNVTKAINYCKENGLMEFKDGLYHLQSNDTQVWCVYDRDVEKIESEIPVGNTKFDLAVEASISAGFKAAWSNDAFELWVLLHFENADFNDEIYKNRKTYYDKLTEIFKSLPNPKMDLVNALKYPSFNYKQDLKHENNFRNIVRNEIVGKTKDAIKRAKKLEAHYTSRDIPNHEKAPCTLVHHLVEELVRLGGKEI